MKIFLTGATGYIGSAVLDAALRANHQITALVRTPQAVDVLASRGVTPVLGDLGAVKSYRAAAEAQDAYIHAAADSSPKREEVDRKALDTLMALASARAKSSPVSFVYTSGIWVLGSNAQPMDETAQPNPGQLLGWRPAHEQLILQAAGPNLRTAVIRPGVVYGGNRGIVSDLLKNALNGLIRVIGTGENHWPLVYNRDLADLYVRVAAMPAASGLYHANDEGDETVNAIVEGIVGHLSMSPDVRHVPLEEARKKLGTYADALALDQRVRGPRARALGWSPTLHSVGTNVPRLLEEFRRAQERAA
jgi:nucleoside-diphosphate-sugar epimerase